MANSFLEGIQRGFNKVGFTLMKKKPELMLAGGIIAGGACVYLACRATLKIENEIDEIKSDIDDVKAAKAEADEKRETATGTLMNLYSDKDYKRDLTVTYIKAGGRLVKLYMPSIIFGSLAVGLLLGSHNEMKMRNDALAAAYATVDQAFKNYRKKVAEVIGEEEEQKIAQNIYEEEEVIVNEDGTTETVKVNKQHLGMSPYAKFFDKSSPEWTDDPEYNSAYVINVQNEANRLLRSHGYLFLNDVYYMLGIPKTKAGQVVGWIFDKNNPVGDNRVRFGLDDENNEKMRDFINVRDGRAKSVLLDFNVDGDILNRLDFTEM